MADDFQRLLAGYRRAHRLLDIPGIAYFQSVHAFRPAFPARPIEMAVFVPAIRLPDHPSKGVAERHKGELSRAAMRMSVDGLGSRPKRRPHTPSQAASRHIGSLGSACARRSHFDRYRSIYTHNSSYIELYL
jgi:hypothetical protein